jgi:hypothetical protein
MRKLLYGVLFFSIFIIVSCNNKALDFNNRIAEIQSSVMPKVQVLAGKISNNTDTTDVSTIGFGEEAKTLVTELKQKLNSLDSLVVPEGGEQFKKSVIDQFNFQINYFTNYSIYADTSVPQAEKATALVEMIKQSQGADSILNNMLTAQKAFAQKHKLQILPEEVK